MRRVPPSLQRAEEAQVDGGAAQEPGLLGRLFSMSQVSIFSFLVLDGQGQQEGARQDCISSRVNNFYSCDLHVVPLCVCKQYILNIQPLKKLVVFSYAFILAPFIVIRKTELYEIKAYFLYYRLLVMIQTAAFIAASHGGAAHAGLVSQRHILQRRRRRRRC